MTDDRPTQPEPPGDAQPPDNSALHDSQLHHPALDEWGAAHPERAQEPRRWGASGYPTQPVQPVAGPTASDASGPSAGSAVWPGEPAQWSPAGWPPSSWPPGSHGATHDAASASVRPASVSPGWGERPGAATSGWGMPRLPASGLGETAAPRSRRRSPWAAVATLLALLLALVGGYAVAQFRSDRSAATTASQAGVPVATPTPGPVPANQPEPVAAVARALAPAVVQLETSDGLGSGVVYDARGYILTAAHVVSGSKVVAIRLPDGSKISGTVVGADEASDIAVVKAARGGLRTAVLAIGAKLEVGQMAIAIGSPFGLDQTVTAGIVSAVHRSIGGRDGSDPRDVIQTDAPINPGNSGGALADRQGRVIGINDSIISQNGGNQGVGFAIPIDTAAAVAARLVRGDPPATSLLGVTLTDASGGAAGALITKVERGSAASRAGFRTGDLVTGFNGAPIEGANDLSARVHGSAPGATVTMDVRRGGRTVQLRATLGAKKP